MDFEQKKFFGSTGQNDPQGLSLKIHNNGTETKSLRSFWPGHPKQFFCPVPHFCRPFSPFFLPCDRPSKGSGLSELLVAQDTVKMQGIFFRHTTSIAFSQSTFWVLYQVKVQNIKKVDFPCFPMECRLQTHVLVVWPSRPYISFWTQKITGGT